MIIGLIGGGLLDLPPGKRYPTLAQGKDTVADYLALKGFVRVAFADNLKKEVAEAYRTTVARLEERELKETAQPYLALIRCHDAEFIEVALTHLGLAEFRFGDPSPENAARLHAAMISPRSPRWVTQLWGTEYRRQRYGDDYWAKQGCRQVSGPGSYTVTDVRMPNEPAALEAIDAKLVRIIRPGFGAVDYTGKEHATETALLRTPVAWTLINREDDFDGLYRQIEEMLAAFRGSVVPRGEPAPASSATV